jgi:hypothetical protein
MCWVCSVSAVKYTQNFWQFLGWISGFRHSNVRPSSGFWVCYIHITLYYRFWVLNFFAKYCTLLLPFYQWQSYQFVDHTLNTEFCSIFIIFVDLPYWTSLHNIISHEPESKSKSSPLCQLWTHDQIVKSEVSPLQAQYHEAPSLVKEWEWPLGLPSFLYNGY